jgi:hypothetical protein|tara:strand:+ start:3731 stop:3985 length:255 start_codon:yes stop_codon:yes gene_type:complete
MQITVYKDTSEKFHDPYTIIIDRKDKTFPKEMWGMNRSGGYYFSRDSRDMGYSVGKHLGKKIKFHDLDLTIQKSIINNLILIVE